MNINISQKLGLSAALVVGIVGCFSESAEAGRFRFSGNSDNSVDADFILDTEKEIIEELTLKDVDGETFATASIGGVNASQFEDFGELESLLDRSIDPEDLGFTPTIQYNLTFGTDEVERGILYIPSDFEGIDEDNPSVNNFDNIFENNSQDGKLTQLIPGILIRKEGDNEIVENFGIGASEGFTVTELKKQGIPEPTTAAGLLATLFVGGLSLRKGDRRIKSKAIIRD
jgi:hypothetical protein